MLISLIVLVSKEEDVSGITLFPFIVLVFIAITILSTNFLMTRIPPLLGMERYTRYKSLNYRVVLLFIASIFVSLSVAFGLSLGLFQLFSQLIE